MKRMIYCMLAIVFISSSCMSSKYDQTEPEEKNALPEGYTIKNIEESFIEFLNYKRVMNLLEYIEDSRIDDYEGTSVSFEIMACSNGRICALTGMGTWCAWFEITNGYVRCTAFSKPGENGWPELGDDYRIVSTIEVVIPEKRKPNFGTSERKGEMITLLEDYFYSNHLKDFEENEETKQEYNNTELYIGDFYESDLISEVWLIKKDNMISNIPFTFDYQNGELTITRQKPWPYTELSNFSEEGQNYIRKSLEYSLLHVTINDEYITKMKEKIQNGNENR